jgi:hypothetical protein
VVGSLIVQIFALALLLSSYFIYNSVRPLPKGNHLLTTFWSEST